MKGTARCVLLLLAIGVAGERARADGKFYAESVPADIPYQRAFMLFHEGSETLVLQSKYELSQSANVNPLGWVVPVPTVPEVGSVDAGAAEFFFLDVSSRTQPALFHISTIFFSVGVVFFLSGLVLLLLCLVEYPFRNNIGLSEVTWRRLLMTAVVVVLVGFVLTIAGAPSLSEEAGDVEVVKAEKVGIYDVKVIRSQSTEAILAWLKENGFGFGDSDVQIFEDYVDREWCFVVAKVESDTETKQRKIISGGMVAPLILKFQTGTAVYPLALTSTIGADTEVLLYTLSRKKLSCGERLILRYARSTKLASLIHNLLDGAQRETSALFTDIPKSMFLCKFKKKLKPEEMKWDIEFEFAPDNDPYAETKIVW